MIFSYYGSKSKLWAKYPAPLYDTIIEPFAGAANYALRHCTAKRVIIIEKNPIIAAMWRWLQTVDPDFIRALPHPDPKTRIPDIKPIEARHFLGFMLNQGSEAPRNYVGGFEGVKRLNWDSVANEVSRVRDWEVIEGDFTESPDISATWYIDPPYIGQKRYPCGRDLNYPVLAEWCKSRKGQVIVCENDTATWLPFRPLCLAPGQRKTSKLRNEGIWTNENI